VTSPVYPEIYPYRVPRSVSRAGEPRGRELVLLVRHAAQRFELVCFCSRRRRDGVVCAHTARFSRALRPWVRSRTKIVNPKRPAEGVRAVEVLA
jgi:hypothetical protein